MADERKLNSAQLERHVHERFQSSMDTKAAFLQSDAPRQLAKMAEVAANTIADGNKLMFCGNGGSAADAQHLAAECLVRLRSSHDRQSLPALTLATDSSMMTACANDYSFDDVFSRPLMGLGRPGDVLIGITTSGNSQNVINALIAARNAGIRTFGFLGGDGGKALAHCDLALVVPSENTGTIQETHITAGHTLLEMMEDLLSERGIISR